MNNNIVMKSTFNILASLLLLSGMSSFTNPNKANLTFNDSTKIEKKAVGVIAESKETYVITVPGKKTIRKGDQEIQRNMQHLIHEYMNPVLMMPNMLLSDQAITHNFFNDYKLFINQASVLDADTEMELQFQMEQLASQIKELLSGSDAIMNDDFFANQYIYADKSAFIVSDDIIHNNFVTEIAE